MDAVASIFSFTKGTNAHSQEYLNERKLPPYILYTTIAICLIPSFLNLCGIDFDASKGSLPQPQEDALRVFRGAFIHSLLEWSAVTIAFVTVLLSFGHYFVVHNPTTLIISVALLCAGSMDAFHTLAATHLIEATAPNQDLIPFSWALCRVFNGAICFISALSIIMFRKHIKGKHKTLFAVGVATLFITVAYIAIHAAAISENLPQTQFPDSMIRRPWDVFPGIMFLLVTPLYLIIFRRDPTPFAHSLLISIIPSLAVQIHMVFGSSVLFDNHFNIAHFLKIVAYLVLFIGLIYDYARISRFATELHIKTKALIDTNPSAIITINDHGIIQDANPHASTLFGYTTEELVNSNISMLVAPPHQKNHDQYLANYRRTGIPKIIGKAGLEVFCLKKNGEKFPTALTVGEFVIDDKKFFTGIMNDITDKHRFEQDLIRTNEELAQFSYRTSHDLKAPLITVRGLSQVICEDLDIKDYEEAKRNAIKIGAQVSKLEQLVIDILNLARMDLDDDGTEDIPLHTTALDIMKNLESVLANNDVQVQHNIDPSITIRSSKIRLSQVLENLISNAIKYHNPEAASPYVKISAHTKGRNTEISIEDNGLGIPEAHHEKIFKMFQRFHPDVAHGSGLGMHLIKKHLDKMNGKISFSSTLGKGTTFTILIPNEHKKEA